MTSAYSTSVLSGIIAHEGSSGRPGDVELVESLVKTYIVKPSCLILLTVSCESESDSPYLHVPVSDCLPADFENQGAARLAQIEDPDGARTIGTLLTRTPHMMLTLKQVF
jgi:hypothetical protein